MKEVGYIGILKKSPKGGTNLGKVWTKQKDGKYTCIGDKRRLNQSDINHENHYYNYKCQRIS